MLFFTEINQDYIETFRLYSPVDTLCCHYKNQLVL